MKQTIWVALFRGINVGGHNSLPMQTLALALERNGCADVKTYIQSGNVVLRTTGISAQELAEKIETTILNEFGFATKLHLLTSDGFRQAAASNPFKDAEADPKSLHLFFLAEQPVAPDLDALLKLSRKSENFLLQGTTFYLHAPEGIGRSKLAVRAEKVLGVSATGRNWRTVSRILDMLS